MDREYQWYFSLVLRSSVRDSQQKFELLHEAFLGVVPLRSSFLISGKGFCFRKSRRQLVNADADVQSELLDSSRAMR